jgi:hypothetical protein
MGGLVIVDWRLAIDDDGRRTATAVAIDGSTIVKSAID